MSVFLTWNKKNNHNSHIVHNSFTINFAISLYRYLAISLLRHLLWSLHHHLIIFFILHSSFLMIRIGILSDTHSIIHPRTYEFFKDCDEIWHAGDIGNFKSAEDLRKFKPFRAVYGNIDGGELRKLFPRDLVLVVEKVKVLMTHIGGYPGRYEKTARELIVKERPQLFVTGHSHILKVMFDKNTSCFLSIRVRPGNTACISPSQW